MSETALRTSISPRVLRRGPPELIKIKIGELGEPRQKSGGTGSFRLPQKLPYFKLTKRIREEATGDEDRGNFVRHDEIHEVVGDEPTELDCRLMFSSPAENFVSSLQQYSGRTKIVECDGETARDLRKNTVGTCSHPDCKCKPYGRLQVILDAAPTFGSVAVFRTTSWETVRNIQSTLEMLYDLMPDDGTGLAGIPMVLKLYPAEVSYEQGGKQKTATAYKVALEVRGSIQDVGALVTEARKSLRVAPQDLRLLAAARATDLDELDREEEGEFAEEFHPDPNGVSSVRTRERIDEIKQKVLPAPADDGAPDGEYACTSCGEILDSEEALDAHFEEHEREEREAIKAEAEREARAAERQKKKGPGDGQRRAEAMARIGATLQKYGGNMTWPQRIARDNYGTIELLELPVEHLEQVDEELANRLAEKHPEVEASLEGSEGQGGLFE